MAPSFLSDSASEGLSDRRGGRPRIEFVAVGSELLSGRRAECNSIAAQKLLAVVGLSVERVTIVADAPHVIAQAIREAVTRSDVLILSGGLGPTFDDVTREALAGAAGAALQESQQAAAMVRAFFARLGRCGSESNARQALLPDGATPLANAIGSAPGIDMRIMACRVFALPGVPAEFVRMLEDEVLGRLCDLGVVTSVVQRSVHVVGLPESLVAERIAALNDDSIERVRLGVTADQGTISVSLDALASDQVDVDRLESAILSLFGEAVYGTGSISLAEATGRRLIETGTTLAVAESCTGGLLAARLTSVAGISAVFLEGCVVYTNEAKVRTLDVPRRVIEAQGAVSREVADAMATGIAARAGSDLGVGITGIAGPTGGTPEKPIGLVYLALFDRGDVTNRKLKLAGDRQAIRERTTVAALDLIRRSRTG